VPAAKVQVSLRSDYPLDFLRVLWRKKRKKLFQPRKKKKLLIQLGGGRCFPAKGKGKAILLLADWGEPFRPEGGAQLAEKKSHALKHWSVPGQSKKKTGEGGQTPIVTGLDKKPFRCAQVKKKVPRR